MLYICEDCGMEFDEEEMWVEYDDPSPAGVSLSAGQLAIDCGCPHCGGNSFVEANICKECGEPYNPKYGEVLCKDCQESLLGELMKMAKVRNIKFEDLQDAIGDAFGW